MNRTRACSRRRRCGRSSRSSSAISVGQPALETRALWERMHLASYYWGRAGLTQGTIGGIEMALWDLKGKALGQPVHQLLGGKVHESLEVYASGGNPKPMADLEAEMRGYVEAGFGTVKIRICDMGRAEMVRVVECCRNALGHGIQLAVDAVQGIAKRPWPVKTAAQVARWIEPYDIRWIEEPIEVTDVAGMAELRKQIAIPLAGGESMTTLARGRKLRARRRRRSAPGGRRGRRRDRDVPANHPTVPEQATPRRGPCLGKRRLDHGQLPCGIRLARVHAARDAGRAQRISRRSDARAARDPRSALPCADAARPRRDAAGGSREAVPLPPRLVPPDSAGLTPMHVVVAADMFEESCTSSASPLRSRGTARGNGWRRSRRRRGNRGRAVPRGRRRRVAPLPAWIVPSPVRFFQLLSSGYDAYVDARPRCQEGLHAVQRPRRALRRRG